MKYIFCPLKIYMDVLFIDFIKVGSRNAIAIKTQKQKRKLITPSQLKLNSRDHFFSFLNKMVYYHFFKKQKLLYIKSLARSKRKKLK